VWSHSAATAEPTERLNVREGETCNSLAVVVFQLGGPDSLAAVEPFLFNLFSDPDIIDFPFARLARPTMARLISSRRARHAREHYAAIGGQSPIRHLTERQAAALERELRKSVNARVFVAMRYWHPLTEEAVEQVIRGNFRELVLLPLHPQYSKTTSGSSLKEWQRQWAAKSRNHIPTRIIPEFHDHAGYLDAVVEKINEGLARFRPASVSAVAPVYDRRFSARRSQTGTTDDVHLVFSAHGVPLSVIAAGDPYQQHIEATVRGVMAHGGWPNPHVLCYQSRVSPGRWLEPSLNETLRALAERATKRVLVIPIAFVTDHVETLSEINIEARRLAENMGIAQFELMPALNDSPTFIRALVNLVLRKVAGEA